MAISGAPRDGRRPTSHYAFLLEKIGKATIDDVIKEHILGGLPTEVRRQLADKTETLSAKEIATLADQHFDKDGRLLHSNTSTDVNHIETSGQEKNSSTRRPPVNDVPRGAQGSSNTSSTASFSTPFEQAENADVNAVKFKDGLRQNVNVSNRASNYSRGRGGQRGNASRGRDSNNRYAAAASGDLRPPANGSSTKKVCDNHIKYGDQTRNCQEGCMLFSQHASKAPKGRPGQRT